MRFPTVDEMKEGLGGIQLDFDAGLPRGGRNRKLTFENRHLGRIAAYLVNCLVPRDADIRIAAQTRNYSQSIYELEYEDTGVPASAELLAWWPGRLMWVSPLALLLSTRLTYLRYPRGWPRWSRKGEPPDGMSLPVKVK
jgi:hypothetical protein